MKTPKPSCGGRSTLALAACLTVALGACAREELVDPGPDLDASAVEEILALVAGTTDGVTLVDGTGKRLALPNARALRFSMALADVSPDEIFVAFLEEEGFARSPAADGAVFADRFPWSDGQVFHRIDVSAMPPLAMVRIPGKVTSDSRRWLPPATGPDAAWSGDPKGVLDTIRSRWVVSGLRLL